jgi:hypothetical protein
MDENGRAPGGLWVLPIFLGIIGGVIAMIISNIAYHESGWQFFIVSILVTVLLYFLLFVIFGNVFMTYLF